MRELPVNWWVQPSVIRTFSSRGDMSMGTAAAGSNMTFSPSRNGTSLDLQAGLEARVRENITTGVQAGYAHSVSGSSAEGYNGQATLNVTFDNQVTLLQVPVIMTGAFTFREQQICRVVHHVYCPKALSHANRLLPSKQLTAMCLLKMTGNIFPAGYP